MRRTAGALFILSGGLCAPVVFAQSAAPAPPTAQFPPAEPNPAPAPSLAPAATTPAAPPAAPPPSPPTTPTPPSVATPPATPAYPAPTPPPAYPAYPAYPVYAYPYAYPTLVPIAQPKPAASDSDEVFTVALAPLLLIAPIVQLTGELRATPHFGVAAIVGYGSIAVDTASGSGLNPNASVTAYEFGGRLTGYPLKKFKGLQLGAQLMYLHIASNGSIAAGNVTGTGAGVAGGPFAGYKLVTDIGFTFVGQLGVQYLSAQAESHDDSGNSNSADSNRFLALLNLEVGWSF